MRLLLTILALTVLVQAGLCQKKYPLACNPDDPIYDYDSSAPKLKPYDGFELYAHTPIYLEISQDIATIPDLEKPYSETFFFRVFSDQEKRGSMYISFKHKLVQMLYDKKRNESIVVDFQWHKCDVKEMYIDPEYPYGYFHGNTPIHIPFFDKLLDLRKFKTRRLGNTWYRGFRDVMAYEGCLNLHDMMVRVLKDVDLGGGAKVPDFILKAIPNPVAMKVKWYWADPSWEMEDGTYDFAHYVPLGFEVSGAMSAEADAPKPLPPKVHVDLLFNSSMSFANYHSHYPAVDLENEDLMQVPITFSCKRQPSEADPTFMPFPNKYHIKAETVVYGENPFVYNSEEYYDYDDSLFRYDVSLHRPDKRGPVKMEVFHDYKKNIAFEINRDTRTCKKADLNTLPTPSKWSREAMEHLLMRPYDIMNLGDIDLSYMGKKYCRGMNCHFWSGQKDFKTPIDGKPAYGIFNIWATTSKWSQNFSTSDPMMKHFIVEMDIQMFHKDTKTKVGNHHLHLFDYKQISNRDLFFIAPTAEFCGSTETPPTKPYLPNRYQYRGEYSDSFASSSIPIFVNYDVDWNVIRFDWIPAMFDDSKESMKYRQAYIYDRSSQTNYQVNLVNGQCIVEQIPAEYEGEGIDPLHIIWPPRLHQQLVSRNMRYVGVHQCRRMSCDTFEVVEPRDPSVTHIYEYQFTTSAFTEVSIDNPSHEQKNVLSRIARYRMEDGDEIPDRFRSVDIFGYVDQRSIFWEYEIAAPCFENVKSQWIRMHFTADSPDALKHIHNDYFRVEVMEATRQNASNITPMRIADFVLEGKPDQTRFSAEFKLRDRHPKENFHGPSLNDAIQSLSEGIATGGFVVTIKINPPDPTTPVLIYKLTADKTLEQCNKPCSVDQWEMPIIELDGGALAGTIIGSIFAGLIVVFVGMTIFVSRKHQVPMQSLYVGTVPGTGVSHDLPPVSMSGGIAVANDQEDK